MANSKFDYVRSFEMEDKVIPNVWIVVRIDGKAFHKFAKEHQFDKPNDERGKWFWVSECIPKTNCLLFLLHKKV